MDWSCTYNRSWYGKSASHSTPSYYPTLTFSPFGLPRSSLVLVEEVMSHLGLNTPSVLSTGTPSASVSCLLSLSFLSACSLLPSWLPSTPRGPCPLPLPFFCYAGSHPPGLARSKLPLLCLCHPHLLHSGPLLLFPFTAQCLVLIVSHCSFYFEELSTYVLWGLPISCS